MTSVSGSPEPEGDAAPKSSVSPRPPAAPGRRVLGDAWQDWDSGQAPPPARTDAGPGLFYAVHLGLVLIAAAAWTIGVWLAEPRLLALGAGGPVVGWLRGLGYLLLAGPPLMLAVVWAGGPLPRAGARLLEGWLVALWWPCETMAARLGVSRDRLGHSYVHFTNRLSLLSRRAGPGDGLIVLAPRCLSPALMRGLRTLADEGGAAFVVATGGEEARAAMRGRRSAAVLAVACERDLVAGLREVLRRHTVLALANRRPEGPCRNSEIDLPEARRCLDELRHIVSPGPA